MLDCFDVRWACIESNGAQQEVFSAAELQILVKYSSCTLYVKKY